MFGRQKHFPCQEWKHLRLYLVRPEQSVHDYVNAFHDICYNSRILSFKKKNTSALRSEQLNFVLRIYFATVYNRTFQFRCEVVQT